jgi:succinate dehydrogenase/fumarate reductase flavoprotein subunit
MSTISCDVVVVGAGIAGFSAAVRAVEMGAAVVLLDKSDGPLGDGNTLMTSGSFRAGGRRGVFGWSRARPFASPQCTRRTSARVCLPP